MRGIVICCMLGVASADLRQAAWPKKSYQLRQDNGGRGGVNFVAATTQTLQGGQKAGGQKGIVAYVEPTTANYQGLKNQRKNNYDNFLRSNIDNEQDNRNFNNEAGLDMQPFRTCESQSPLSYPYDAGNAAGANKCDGSLQNVNNGNTMNPILRAAPGEPRMTPLRWNNPHASEIEVNLWIMASDPPTIVPIKKPTCSGEGNQNNILQWAIPSDFNQMDWTSCDSTKGKFTGCKQAGDCMLQIYAHSVETRQYSSATPIIIEGAFTGQKLNYNSVPKDSNEQKNYVYPTTFDMESMILGVEPGDPKKQGKKTGIGQSRSIVAPDPTQSLKVCASSEKNGVAPNGDIVDQVELLGTDTAYKTLNSPNVNLYLCKRTDVEVQAEQEVKSVTFDVSTSADGQAYTNVGTRLENYSPFQFSSTNHFGGSGIKQIKVTIKLWSNSEITKTVFLDLRESGTRWRFRRHLQTGCANDKLSEPKKDVRFNLGALKRETCMPSTDPNSNYDRTTLQRAVLHSDVANHAYQNSDYSPYMGQQAGEISRTMQAASVIHMTSGNRGELGKNMIPNRVKTLVKQLNKKVNNIYQNYEKVANKIIDDLSQAQKNGQNANVGAQSLGVAFRAEEKGATSTKRLKTTTYVPSFEVANYDLNVINNAIQEKTGGNKNAYKDILTAPNPKTNKQFVMIYTSTLYRMLPDFQKAAEYGVTYQASIEKTPCSVLDGNDALKQASVLVGAGTQQADSCCTGSLLNAAAGGCGATFNSLTSHKKRNAANKKDGGLYAAKTFMTQHYMTMYNCPSTCIERTQDQGDLLAQALVKTSKGTCINWINANTQLCEAQETASATDCRGCGCIYDNSDPSRCREGWGDGGLQGVPPAVNLPKQDPSKLRSILNPGVPEAEGNVVKAAGFNALGMDDTAICHTESSFSCPSDNKEFLTESDYAVLTDGSSCKETESVKIDTMCLDSPCDTDKESSKCQETYDSCQYDPDSGVMCQPKSENDPCEDCVCTSSKCFSPKYGGANVDSGNGAYLALTSMIVLVAML